MSDHVVCHVDAFQVTMLDIVKHFNGSEEQFISDLVHQLEGEFFIYKKNNVYRLM